MSNGKNDSTFAALTPNVPLVEPAWSAHYNPPMTERRGVNLRGVSFRVWLLLVCASVISCSHVSAPQMPAIPGLAAPSEDEEVRISREFRRDS